jgi:hypothetical protein
MTVVDKMKEIEISKKRQINDFDVQNIRNENV